MTTKQTDGARLRRETAALLYEISEDANVQLTFPSELVHRFSRCRNGHIRNPVEELAEIVDALGVDAWLRVRAWMDARCVEDDGACVHRLMLEEQEADNEEDMAGLLAAQDPSKRRLHRDRLVRHMARAGKLIAAYDRLDRSPPPQRSRRNGTHTRRSA